MYIHDLETSWVNHPFLASHFLIKDEATIQRIASAGIREVVIDSALGLDVPVQQPVMAPSHDEFRSPVKRTTPATIEIERARHLYLDTTNVVRNLMSAARSGNKVSVDQLRPSAERVVQSAVRNRHALSSISRIKSKDEYTFMHCVGVSALLVSFAIEMGLPEETLEDLAVGGLVHDIGKALVPQQVLNKPGRLDESEFGMMKSHVTHSRELLLGLPGITQNALDVALLHHERVDGSGYPGGVAGDSISLIGRMSAIVDVYDALTSVRVYKEAWEPTHAMKHLFENSGSLYDGDLVQRFVRCIGIYPVGTTVALESGRVGIVIEQTDSLTRPIVRIVYNRVHRRFERPIDVDMRHNESDRLAEAIDPAVYGITPTDFY